MFRRRGPVRSMRPVGKPGLAPALQQAQEWMARGEYAAAIDVYDQFARRAVEQDGPRAPLFLLQAGKARLLNKQVPEGIAFIMQGLGILAARQQGARLAEVGERVVAELRALGLEVEAREIHAYLAASLPPLPSSLSVEAGKSSHPVLPTTCPGCGAPVLSSLLEWVDDVTAECPYCGGALRGES